MSGSEPEPLFSIRKVKTKQPRNLGFVSEMANIQTQIINIQSLPNQVVGQPSDYPSSSTSSLASSLPRTQDESSAPRPKRRKRKNWSATKRAYEKLDSQAGPSQSPLSPSVTPYQSEINRIGDVIANTESLSNVSHELEEDKVSLIVGFWSTLKNLRRAVSTKLGEWNEKKKVWDAWNPDRNHPLAKFINYSKLAALKETIKPNKTIISRIGWSSVFLGFLIFGLGLSWDSYSFSKANPLTYGFEPKQPDIRTIPAPTVTICPPNSLKTSVFEKSSEIFWERKDGVNGTNSEINLKEVSTVLYLMDHICRPKTSLTAILNKPNQSKIVNGIPYKQYLGRKMIVDEISDSYRQKVMPELSKASFNCSEIVTTCVWDMKSGETCESHLEPVLTSSGGCCAFNKIPDEVLYKYSNKSLKSFWQGEKKKNQSKLDGWKDWNSDPHPFSDQDRRGEMGGGPLRQNVAGLPWGSAFIIPMEEKGVMCPQFDSGGYRVSIDVPGVDTDASKLNVPIPPNSEVNIKVFPELSLADDDIRAVSIGERDCYFPDEHELKYYGRYSQENCQAECLADLVLKECGCTLISYPNSPGKNLCTGKKMTCVIQVELQIKEGYEKVCSQCRSSCDELTLREETQVSPFTLSNNPDMLIKGKKGPFSIVRIFYAQTKVLTKKKKMRQSKWELVREIGSIFESTNDVSFIGLLRWILAFGCFSSSVWALNKFYRKYIQIIFLRTAKRIRCRKRKRRRRRRVIQVQRGNVGMISSLEIDSLSRANPTQKNTTNYNVFLA